MGLRDPCKRIVEDGRWTLSQIFGCYRSMGRGPEQEDDPAELNQLIRGSRVAD